MQIGILALQGAFIEHRQMLETLNQTQGADGTPYEVTSFEIRKREDADRPMDGIIFPGGESTAMQKLLLETGLLSPLKELVAGGLPAFGTCAGLIVLAKEVNGGQPILATMDVTVQRNAYGRQLGSFHTQADFASLGNIPMTFIRAPYIESVRPGVSVLASVDGRIVAARQGNQLGTAFHPELTKDSSVHRYFLEMIREKKNGK